MRGEKKTKRNNDIWKDEEIIETTPSCLEEYRG